MINRSPKATYQTLSINTYAPNPFGQKPTNCTWSTNFIDLKSPNLRTLAGVAPLDRGLASTSY